MEDEQENQKKSLKKGMAVGGSAMLRGAGAV